MRTSVKRLVIAAYNHGLIGGAATAFLFRLFKLSES